jgi:two-component system, OmpR family, sensor kinase
MLRLARLGQHPGQSSEPVDVTALVNACAERVRIADPARTWRVSVAGGLAATGDEELLRRAVDNLLTNVLAHTTADTAATITASGDPDEVTIEVHDDGPGVPPDKLPPHGLRVTLTFPARQKSPEYAAAGVSAEA